MSSWVSHHCCSKSLVKKEPSGNFLLGRNLKYVLPELRGSDVYDSLIHVSCTRLGVTTISLSEGHVERMDRHINLVVTWKTKWRIG